MTNDQIAKYGKIQQSKIVGALTELLPKLPNGDKQKFNIIIDNEGTNELSISVEYFGYSIDLITVDRSTIAGTVEVPGWQVTGLKREPDTDISFGDVFPDPKSEHTSPLEAVHQLIVCIFSDYLDGCIESLPMESEHV